MSLNFRKGPPVNDNIEKTLAGHAWLRFSPNQYYVHTHLSAAELYYLIRPLMHSDDLIMTVEVDISNRHGWISTTAVEWLKGIDAVSNFK